MKSFGRHLGWLLALASLAALRADPVAHPDRPDRLLATREGMTVEYSPGQEAWVDMAFAQMRKMAAAEPVAVPAAAAAPAPARATPGSARDLRERRAALLAAIARQVGFDQPTKLQGEVYDTFLGYYEVTSELAGNASELLPGTVTIRHLAIWQRDDLVGRLRQGARIEGMTYDAATGGGKFEFKFKDNSASAAVGERIKAIYDQIEAQRLKHRLDISEDHFSASVTLGGKPKEARKEKKAGEPDAATAAPEIIFPVIYRGDASTAPTEAAFDFLPRQLAAAREALVNLAATYRDPRMVNIILHETAETGLIEKVIRSPDRRWLCDGTANYVAWRVTRDLIAADFAQRVYDLDAQLRLHAAEQPKINLLRWTAVEQEKAGETETDLTRAHYAFATRVMFQLAARHGDAALGQLWADVARTPRKKVTAQTFADAYRKRFKADLKQLIAAAEKDPIAVVAAAPR